MANSFTETRDSRNIDKIREIEDELPQVVTEFMNDSRIRDLTTLTRLGYIRDLRTFFYFLPQRVRFLRGVHPSQITTEQLGALKKTDFDMYPDYLDKYVKPKYGTDDVYQPDTQAPYTKARRSVKDKEPIGATKNSSSGRARKIVAVRAFFKYLFENKYIETNYTELLHVPKIPEKEIIYLKENEIARVLETVRNGFGEGKQASFLEKTRRRDMAIMSLLLATGIRASECIGLDIEHINMADKSFVVTRKGGKEKRLFFNQTVADILQEYLDERAEIEPVEGHEHALFLSSQRKRMSPKALQNLVKKYASAACPDKEHLSPHKMRASFGTALYRKKGILTVANTLGHSNINTTKKHYIHADEEERAEAAEAVDWIPEN